MVTFNVVVVKSNGATITCNGFTDYENACTSLTRCEHSKQFRAGHVMRIEKIGKRRSVKNIKGYEQ